MWSRIVMTILGIWMMVAPEVFKYSKNIADNAHITGPLIATFSLISLSECTRNVRLLNLPVAFWMLMAPLFVFYDNDNAIMHDYGIALLTIFLCAIRPVRKHSFAGGWLSLVK